MFKLFSKSFKKGKFQGLINCIRSLSLDSGLDQLISRASWSRQTISQPEKMQPSKRRKGYFYLYFKLWKYIYIQFTFGSFSSGNHFCILHSFILDREGLDLTLSIWHPYSGDIFWYIPGIRAILINTVPRDSICQCTP